MIGHLALSQRNYNIQPTDEEIVIDGLLNEDIWKTADVAGDFIIKYPDFGSPSKYKTEMRMTYDSEAFYVAGILYDPKPDSVSYTLSQRDNFGNADWFGFSIDPYATNVNAFTFIVTSAGVELDALEFADYPDFSWNAVWKSNTVKRDDGWSVEIRIPFSAIRFPNKDLQTWNFNMVRQVRRDREQSTWNPMDPAIYGEITQSGTIKGVKEIKSPLRLSLTPYVTGYLENSFDSELNKQTWKSRVTGGMDLKYGLNDAFTLDMTLIPDFGQTTSDRQVLNLGPFEVFYNENRPFFLEGMDLFGIGDVFYSRRIGGQPFNYHKAEYELKEGEEIISSANESPLINATKVSGRTSKGLGIGVFNAIEGRAEALISDSLGNVRSFETNSLTNYNVFVLSQNVKNNGSVSFVNTNVMREGANADANVSLGRTTLFTSDKKFKVDASVKMSSILESDQTTNGHAINTSISKVTGSFGYTFSYYEESDTYNPNDLGFLYNNNSRGYNANFRFNNYSGTKRFLRTWANVNTYYEELYRPQLFSSYGIGGNIAGTMKNFLTCGLNGGISPFGTVNHFESRTFGKEVRFNPSWRFGGFYSSDYSKRFALDFRPNISGFFGTNQRNFGVNISPRIRVSDRMFVVFEMGFDLFENDFGYVSTLDDNYADEIILGTRNRTVVENTLRSEFIFTKRMGVDLRLRHYWQQVDYSSFSELIDGGLRSESNYNPLNPDGTSQHNTSYNAFTLDVNYRWVFVPGSELRIVYKNNLFLSKDALDSSYFQTFETLFDQPQVNSLSMKFLVYVDAIYFRKKGNRI